MLYLPKSCGYLFVFVAHLILKEVSMMHRVENGSIELHLKGLNGQCAEIKIDKFGVVEFVAIKDYPFQCGDLQAIEFLAIQQKAKYMMEISGDQN